MKVVIFGAGVQGTLYGVRLARAHHDVTFIARKRRAAELRESGATIEDAASGRREVARVQVFERLSPDTVANLCLVTVRREQLDAALADLAAATGVARFVIMVNHAHGSEAIFAALGRPRVVLGFPGAAGILADGIARYVEVAEQPTAIDAGAKDVATIFRAAGFNVELIPDMDAWLRRHAVFVTAIAGALYRAGGDPIALAAQPRLVREFIFAVREGWAALDRRGAAPASLALRAIFRWVPLGLAIAYWRRLLRSPRGELYFAHHVRHAPREMAALADDVRSQIATGAVSHLRSLFAAIDAAAAAAAE